MHVGDGVEGPELDVGVKDRGAVGRSGLSVA